MSKSHCAQVPEILLILQRCREIIDDRVPRTYGHSSRIGETEQHKTNATKREASRRTTRLLVEILFEETPAMFILKQVKEIKTFSYFKPPCRPF